MKVDAAVQRLARILPLKKQLDELSPAQAKIYLAVINSFYRNGRAALVSELNQVDANATAILAQLAEKDMLTLDHRAEVKGCYPFTMEPRVHRIELNGHRVHAMCAMDALAPAAMFDCRSVVTSECAVTAQPVRVELEGERIINTGQVSDLHFGINWAAANACGSCSESLCTEMLFLKDAATAEAWQEQDAENREIFTLAQAVQFAKGFFTPLMQQG